LFAVGRERERNALVAARAQAHHSRLRRGAGAAEHLGFTAARVTYVWLAVLVPGALVAWGIIDARRRP